MRPIDLARAAGVSQQAVRNYEAQGVIHSAARTEHGHRVYEQRHLDALLAFIALTRAVGHAAGVSITAAVISGRTDDVLEALDRVHAQILTDRETLRRLDGVLRATSGVRPDPRPAVAALGVGELARHIGVTPATSASRPPRCGAGNEPVHCDLVGTAPGIASTRQETFTMPVSSTCCDAAASRCHASPTPCRASTTTGMPRSPCNRCKFGDNA